MPNQKPPTGGASRSDQDFIDVLILKSKKKLPVFEPLEEIALIPYMDVVVNIIMFLMAAIAVAAPLGVVNFFAPAVSEEGSGAKKDEKPPNNLTVAITEKGFVFASSSFVEPAIERKPNGDFDFEALTKKAEDIKKRPGFADEKMVILVAEGKTRYEILIKTMDAIRNGTDKDKTLLFPDVQLSPGVQ